MSTTTSTIDWAAAETVAEGLGLRTRSLVATEDAGPAMQWALQMSREHSSVLALSYYELAVTLGHRDPKAAARASLDWNELLQSVEEIAEAVRIKIADEKAAKVAAEQKAAAEKAAAEQEAAEAHDAT